MESVSKQVFRSWTGRNRSSPYLRYEWKRFNPNNHLIRDKECKKKKEIHPDQDPEPKENPDGSPKNEQGIVRAHLLQVEGTVRENLVQFRYLSVRVQGGRIQLGWVSPQPKEGSWKVDLRAPRQKYKNSPMQIPSQRLSLQRWLSFPYYEHSDRNGRDWCCELKRKFENGDQWARIPSTYRTSRTQSCRGYNWGVNWLGALHLWRRQKCRKKELEESGRQKHAPRTTPDGSAEDVEGGHQKKAYWCWNSSH